MREKFKGNWWNSNDLHNFFKEVGTKRVNVFICHNGFHGLIAERIVEEHFSKDEKAVHVILINDVYGLQNPDLFDLKLSIPGGIKRITYFRQIKRLFHLLGESGLEISFNIPHIGGLLPYYVYDQLKPKYSNLELNLFYEGVLYFTNYDYKDTIGLSDKDLRRRKLFSRLFNFKYKQVGDICPTLSERINGVYSLFPEFTKGYDGTQRFKLITLGKQKLKPANIEKKVIILGQRLKSLNDSQLKSMYRIMLEDLNDFKGKIFYKRHPSDESGLFEQTAEEINLSYEVIRSVEPVELLIESQQPTHIVSMLSSSLINLKAAFGDDLELISYVPLVPGHPIENVYKRITEVFIKIGVKTVDCPC